MNKLVVFDMDGTLVDTSGGIYACHKYTNIKMGKAEPSDSDLTGIIGGPLLEIYINRFGFSKEQARKAIVVYREYYKSVGINGVELYQGMYSVIDSLKNDGYKLAVATLKAEKFAKQILKRNGILDLFDIVVGMDENDERSKSSMINFCIDKLSCENSNTILIGDSEHDLIGAKKSSVQFIGVTYGFGFTRDMVLSYGMKCSFVRDIPQLVKKTFDKVTV